MRLHQRRSDKDSGDENNKDLAVIKSVFVKENLSCSVNIELSYYSCDFLKTICIYCGSGVKNLICTAENYPKCQKCQNKKETETETNKSLCE